ncbi:unnamed protein product [Rotaria socialis]
MSYNIRIYLKTTMAFRIYLHCIYITILFLSISNINGFEEVARSNLLKKFKNLGFSWANCGPNTDPIQLKSLSVAPDPIVIPGNVTFSIGVGVTSALPTDISISVNMEKKVAGLYIKIPCIDNIGSCNYGNLCEAWAEVCPKYFSKFGLPCTCPIPAGAYSIPTTVEYIKGSLPPEILGDFRISGDLRSSSDHLGCIQVMVSLK